MCDGNITEPVLYSVPGSLRPYSCPISYHFYRFSARRAATHRGDGVAVAAVVADGVVDDDGDADGVGGN